MSENVDEFIDIKIKMLHYGTFTIPAAKQVFILGLKEQIAIFTGVISDLHHLLFRGRVLKDNKRLSHYHVEDGDTLYLVPIRLFSQTANNNAADGPILRRGRFIPSLNLLMRPDPNSSPGIVVPDALTFLNGCLNDLECSGNNSQTSGNSMGNEHDSDSTGENQLPIASQMDLISQRMEELLIGEIGQCICDIINEVANCLNHTRVESEERLRNLGKSLVELCHATSIIAMGERPVATLVNHLQASHSQPETDIRWIIIVHSLWSPPSNQQQVITESQNALNNISSPQLTSDEEVLPDPEDEMVKTKRQ